MEVIKLFLFSLYEKKKSKIRMKIIQETPTMLTHRGWKITHPYPHIWFTGFRLIKGEKNYSIIVGENLDVFPDEVLLESSCCYSRFSNIDEVIDHLEAEECYCLEDLIEKTNEEN